MMRAFGAGVALGEAIERMRVSVDETGLGCNFRRIIPDGLTVLDIYPHPSNVSARWHHS